MTRLVAPALAAVAAAALASPASADGARLHKSGPIQITSDGQTVWVVNPDHGSVSRMEAASAAVTQFALPSVGEPQNPRGIALSASGEVWVACKDSDRVYVLDPVSGGVISDLPLPRGSGPVSVAVSPDGSTAVVALQRGSGVAVFDAATRTHTRTITGLYHRPFGLAFTDRPGQVWVSHTKADGEDTFISMIDLSAGGLAAQVVLKSINPKSPKDCADSYKIPEGGYINLIGHIAQPPGKSFLFLPLQYHNFHNEQFTPDSTISTALHKLDLGTRKPAAVDDRVVFSAVWAHKNDRTLVGAGWNAHVAGPIDIAFDQAGATGYLLCTYSNDVLVFPTNIPLAKPDGSAPLTEIGVGDNPIGIVASPVSNTLYVLNYLSRDISVIDAAAGVETARIPATPGTADPVAPNILRGAVLFNSSADPRLSSSGKVSCASCHVDNDSDGHSWNFTQLGAGQRKTLSMKTVGLSFGPQSGGKGQLHRGGDRDEVQDFDFTAVSGVMGGSGFLSDRNPPLGAPNAGKDADLDAIADYVLSLDPDALSPRREADGSLAEAAVRGAIIFRHAQAGSPYNVGCIKCHATPAFTDKKFWDVRGFTQSGEQQGPAFNTAPLIGAWETAPFTQGVGAFKDSATLGGFLRNSRDGSHGDTGKLTEAQMRDLETFLESLDGKLGEDGIDTLADTAPPRILAVRPVSVTSVEVIFSESVDPATASDPANYAFSDGVRTFPAASAVHNAGAGNRVRVAAPLEYRGCPVTYTIQPGPVLDLAGPIQGGASNALDPADPANQKSWTIDGSITVTFGNAAGDETFPSVARDAGFAAGQGDLSFAHWLLNPTSSPEGKGFVAFDFVPTLRDQCGVVAGADILDARFSGRPFFGHVNTVELRRCLMPWGDPPNDWCFGCSGAVTRDYAKYTGLKWHKSGAASRGGSGDSPAEYYPSGAYDVAASVDATVRLSTLNERAEFAGPAVTGAFGFWLDNPTLNFGYSSEVVESGPTSVDFNGAEWEAGQRGFALSLTFAVHATGACGCGPDCNKDGQLNINDFICFQNEWRRRTAYGDYDASGTWTINDFVRFQADFTKGCP